MLSHRRTIMVWEAVARYVYTNRAKKKCVFAFFSFSSLRPQLSRRRCCLQRAPQNIKRMVCWFFYKNKANKNITKTKKKRHRFRRSILQIKSILKRKGRRARNIYPPSTPEARCDSVGNRIQTPGIYFITHIYSCASVCVFLSTSRAYINILLRVV